MAIDEETQKDTQEVVYNEDELDGDAHHSSTTDDGSLKESVLDDQSHQEEQSDDESEAETPVPVRRSGRQRRPPAWFTSGEYDTSKSAVYHDNRSEWIKKVECITNLAKSDLFKGLQQKGGKTILEIVKTANFNTPDSK